MCLLGMTGWALFGLAYLGGAVTLPLMKAAWARVKAWFEAHKP